MPDYQCDLCRAMFDAEEEPQVFLWSEDIPMVHAGTVCQACYLDELLQDANDFFESGEDPEKL